MRSFLLLLFFHASLSVKHSLKYFITASSGLPSFPSLVEVTLVDDFQISYCDSNKKLEELNQAWMQQLLRDASESRGWYRKQCFEILPEVFNGEIYVLRRRFNQSGDVHVLQRLKGCEWDDQTREISGFWQFAYDGEDLISLDLKTQTWVSPRPEALNIKRRLDSERIENENFLTELCPSLLKMYVERGGGSLLSPVAPSVSLLQTSPSSPISCFATGFYPNRADMFWRRDGERVHEDVGHGEILPNPNGTFQMRVDLSSVRAEDWSRYDCVFHLLGVKDDVVTNLDSAGIRTNGASSLESFVVGVIVGWILLGACITGTCLICRRQRKEPSTNTTSETIPGPEVRGTEKSIIYKGQHTLTINLLEHVEDHTM